MNSPTTISRIVIYATAPISLFFLLIISRLEVIYTRSFTQFCQLKIDQALLNLVNLKGNGSSSHHLVEVTTFNRYELQLLRVVHISR